MKMQKLDVMGNAPDNNPKQIVNITYGHHGSGKLYSYYAQNKRTGDIVTPEVTNPKSGKTYKTLAVVRSTHNLDKGQPTLDYLQGKSPNFRGDMVEKPMNLKTIGKTDQRALPGYYSGWGKDAKAAYDLKKETQLRTDLTKMQKQNLFGEIDRMRRPK